MSPLMDTRVNHLLLHQTCNQAHACHCENQSIIRTVLCVRHVMLRRTVIGDAVPIYLQLWFDISHVILSEKALICPSGTQFLKSGLLIGIHLFSQTVMVDGQRYVKTLL